MAGSLNKVMLIGNLGKDPETKHFEGGGMLVKFPIATTENYKNRAGERVEQTEWHNVVVTRKGLAEICEKYLKKGHKVYLEGKIKTRTWTDDAGVTRYMTEINGDNLTMLTTKEDATSIQGKQSTGYTPPPQPAPSKQDVEDFRLANDDDDDLPF